MGYRLPLTVVLATLAVASGGCGGGAEQDEPRGATAADAERQAKAALAKDGADDFGVKCKKQGAKTFACTKYARSPGDAGEISATDVLGQYVATCESTDACEVRAADYTPGIRRRDR